MSPLLDLACNISSNIKTACALTPELERQSIFNRHNALFTTRLTTNKSPLSLCYNTFDSIAFTNVAPNQKENLS